MKNIAFIVRFVVSYYIGMCDLLVWGRASLQPGLCDTVPHPHDLLLPTAPSQPHHGRWTMDNGHPYSYSCAAPKLLQSSAPHPRSSRL